MIQFLQKQFLPRGIQLGRRSRPSGDLDNVRTQHEGVRNPQKFGNPTYASVARENAQMQASRVHYDNIPLDMAHERGVQHLNQQTASMQRVHSSSTGYMSMQCCDYKRQPGLGESVHDIADALAYVMRLRRQEPNQPIY